MQVDIKPARDWRIAFFYLTENRETKRPACEPDMWVKLLETPNPYSFDEALLLCKDSDNKWLVWIPNYGQAILETHQFSVFS